MLCCNVMHKRFVGRYADAPFVHDDMFEAEDEAGHHLVKITVNREFILQFLIVHIYLLVP